MKSKGIPIWERHAEKLVLLIAFVGAVALTALQFIGEPNAVSTTAGDVAPGEIDDLLQDFRGQLLDVELDGFLIVQQPVEIEGSLLLGSSPSYDREAGADQG